tara:strand:+ start:3874 stop:5184 length:1311 start_codon:yes stop_codon:yes gene_type:complete
MSKPLISIIVRTKNENYWIGKCLHAINNQNYKNIEIILVDNSSKDNTVQIVKRNFPKVKIINYKDKKFFPGKAINLGVKKSKGKFIAIISGHCIPKNNFWISNLLKNFNNQKIAGVYGKQEPLQTSDFNIVRELTYLFGNDKKVQTKDPFFHNANSMIRRNVWKKFKFDNKTLHIEDRIWAQKILNKGYKIIYDPNSSVFHHHGVGHSHNISRIKYIRNILTGFKISRKAKKVICMIPILKPVKLKNQFLVENAVNEVLKLKEIYKIFIICDDKNLKRKLSNKKILFLNRGEDLKKDFLGKNYVLREVYKKFIKKQYKPTHILVFQELYPHRPKNFFYSLIKNFDYNYDSLVPISKNVLTNLWKKNIDGGLELIYKTHIPSSANNEYKTFQEIHGLGTITNSTSFEINGIESSNAKFVEVDSKYSFKFDNYIKTLI